MDSNKFNSIIDKYIDHDDLSRHNSNLIYSLPALNAILCGQASKDYWLDKVYGEKIKALHNEGWLYIHNLDVLGPYCSGYSAVDIAIKGLNSTAKNSIKTKAPKHVHSLLGQCSNFISLISQEIHGACAINDITTVVASYLYVEREIAGIPVSYDELCNAWQHFVFEINVPFRAGNSAFSNITMSIGGPDIGLKKEFVAFGGTHLIEGTELTINGKKYKMDRDITYGDIPVAYYDEVNRAFIDIFQQGDATGKPFTFPLITVNITDDFDFNNSVFGYLLEACDSWGGIYLENYRTTPFEEDSEYKHLNKYISPRNADMQKSFCCRFQVSLEDILKINSSIFKSGSGVGGIGVFNINLNRIGYVAQGDWDLFKKLLLDIMDTVQEAAQAKRKFIQENKDLYPYFFYYNKSLDSYYNVISVCGGDECLVNMGIDGGIVSDEGLKRAAELATMIREKIHELIRRDQVPVSLEFAPAESAAPKLAKADQRFYKWLVKADEQENPVSFMSESNDYTQYKDIIIDQYQKGLFFRS